MNGATTADSDGDDTSNDALQYQSVHRVTHRIDLGPLLESSTDPVLADARATSSNAGPLRNLRRKLGRVVMAFIC